MLFAKRLLAMTLSSSRNVSLKGIFPPITTCFDQKGDVDIPKFKDNLDKFNKTGLAGYVAFGSNGEFPLLTSDEKRSILVAAKAAVGSTGKVLIAGAGAESLRQTVANCKMAAEIGADAALVATPWFYKSMMTSPVLIDYFNAVADQSPLPLVLYNVPPNTGVELEADAIISLAKHKNIIGLKDSGGNISKIGTVIYGTKNEDFQVMAGSCGFLLPSLALGAVGGVLGVANVLPQECVQLQELFEQGKMEQAKELQFRLIEPNNMVTRKHGIPGVKAMMDRFGFYGGPVRSPLKALPDAQLKSVVECFEKFGFSCKS